MPDNDLDTGLTHVDYPHEPGRLYDCPACESRCHCDEGYPYNTTECVWGAPEEQHRFHRARLEAVGDYINRLEFGTVFDVTPAGKVEFHPGLHAPDVFHDEDPGDVIIMANDGEPWHALTGMTGQYSYNGAVMHPSEYIGGQIARSLQELSVDEAQTFTVVTVECFDDDEPAGWAILHYRGE